MHIFNPGAEDYYYVKSFIDKYDNENNGRKRGASENTKEENPVKRPRLSESQRTMSGNKFCNSESENLNFLKLIYLILANFLAHCVF